MMMRRWIVCACAVALLSSCSSGQGVGGAGAGGRNAGASRSPGTEVVGSGRAPGASGPGGAGRASPAPTDWRQIRPTGPTRPSGDTAWYYDFVNVEVPEDESWGGADCRPARAGSHCTILFRGIVFLASDTKGFVRFRVYEDGAVTPKVLETISVGRYRSPVYRWVPYTVPAGVRDVQTEVVLENSRHIPVATGHKQLFFISA